MPVRQQEQRVLNGYHKSSAWPRGFLFVFPWNFGGACGSKKVFQSVTEPSRTTTEAIIPPIGKTAAALPLGSARNRRRCNQWYKRSGAERKRPRNALTRHSLDEVNDTA
mmetsp:Transcript_25769/g.70838  ORF Transcript_25769/g.70838 Transcript_25769/m.70838 type:complete len:109 (-) Transcript_25769:1699-2025(-)